MSGVQVRALSLPQQRNCRAQQQVGAKALRVTMHIPSGPLYLLCGTFGTYPPSLPSSSFAVSPVRVPSPVYLLDP